MRSLRNREPVNYNESHLQTQAEEDEDAFDQVQGIHRSAAEAKSQPKLRLSLKKL